MNRIEVYLKAKENLEAFANKRGIETYRLESAYYKPKEYNEIREGLMNENIRIADKSLDIDYPVIYYLFCGHLADRQYMGNIIKFYHKGSDTPKILSEVLYGFDPYEVVKYTNTDEIKQAIEKYNPNKIKNEDKWNEYINGIYDFAKWATGQDQRHKNLSFSEVYSMFKDIKREDDVKTNIFKIRPFYLGYNHITGVGAAVCYNWMKECGAVWLAKPDLHIKRVVAQLLLNKIGYDDLDEIDNEDYDVVTMADKIIDKYLDINPDLKKFPDNKGIGSSYRLKRDEFVAVYMHDWAKEVNTTAYQLDRILYLYCTNGNFYMEDNEESLISEKNLLAMIDSKI